MFSGLNFWHLLIAFALGLIFAWAWKQLKLSVLVGKRVVAEIWKAIKAGRFPRFRASAHPFSENGWTCMACGYQVWWETETQYIEYTDMYVPPKPIRVAPQVIQRSINGRSGTFRSRKIDENENKEALLAAGAPPKYIKEYWLKGEHGGGRKVSVKKNRREAQLLVEECVSYHANICKERIKLSTRQKITNVETVYYDE